MIIKKGDRIHIIGDHPHSGESGTYTGEIEEFFHNGSRMYKIKLENCKHRCSSLFRW